MNYFDTKTNRVHTEYWLKETGVPLQPKILKKLGLFKIEYEYVDYDETFFEVEPDGKPVPKENDKFVYVQKFIVVDKPLEIIRETLKDKAASKRREVEASGIIVQGTLFLTGTEDQNRIATTIQGMRDAKKSQVDFKAGSGWTTLTLDQLIVVGNAIVDHVEACFSREKILSDEINTAISITQLQNVDIDSGWPKGGKE